MEKKKWIQDAIKHKGALRKEAKREHLIKGDEKLSMADLKKLEKKGGKTAKRAYLAATLREFGAGGDIDPYDEDILVFVDRMEPEEESEEPDYYDDFAAGGKMAKGGRRQMLEIPEPLESQEYYASMQYADGGNVVKNKIWKQEWTDTKGVNGYDVLKVLDTDYFSYRYGGGKVVKSEIIESSNSDRVGQIQEDSKQELRNIFAGKYPFAYKMAEGGMTFEGKVERIAKKLEGKRVPKPYQKEYGTKYDKEDAMEAAQRIVGNMTKMERKAK
jgi:hypothetical protein